MTISSTRPFLEDIEKKWISFQLLCALRDCHAADIFHGDIKTENVLVTSWNWLYLSDFSSSFKPTFLPEDNPADFSFYFDTSGRRTCYLAPERFLVAGESPGSRSVNWAMDIFSAGCVIAELFLESPIFTLSQMYKYRKGEYSPEHSQLSKIEDSDIRELILHMIQLEPEARYSADEYLSFWKNKAFPDYFHSFLHQYMSLMTDPSSGRAYVEAESANQGEADERIERIYLDFDKISYFLGTTPTSSDATHSEGLNISTPTLTGRNLPVELDLPSYNHPVARSSSQLPPNDGVLIFLTLIVSNLCNTSKSSARVKACDILLAFAERLSDEAKLDRVLPYVMILLNDGADSVRVAAIRTLAQLLEMVQAVSPVNAYLFSEYIFPRLEPFVLGSEATTPSPMVRSAYASCVASLAHSSLRFLDMIQALRSDSRLTSLITAGSEPLWTEDATYHNLYDVARVDLLEYFEAHTKALLTDSDASVRRSFLGSVPSLCVFFGNVKTNEVILSHLNTYLNDRDWILKCAFFEAVVGVAAYVGSINLEQYLLPLMIQSMTEPEEFVVERVLRSLASMADLGLFQRSTTWDLIHITTRFLIHPNVWIREATAHFVVNSSKFFSVADKYCILTPMVRPFLRVGILNFTEAELLDAVKRPLSRSVYEMGLLWASKTEKGIFWKSPNRDGTLSLGNATNYFNRGRQQRNSNITMASQAKNEEDEQWISRLRSLGLTVDDDFKLLALKEYMWRVSKRQGRDVDVGTASTLGNIIALTQCGVAPQTVFFDKAQKVRPRRRSVDRPEVQLSEEQRHHTIAEALLDASTTIEGRRGEHTSRQQSTTTATPSRTLSPTSDGDQGHHQGEVDDSRPKDLSRIHKKPSAINLLSRKDATTKTSPETGMSSANAVGTVDMPGEWDVRGKRSEMSPVRRRIPVGAIGAEQGLGEQQAQFQANHSYGGNNPAVLRLLDAVFAENYPTDLFDLGPFVKEVDVRRPIRRANAGQDASKIWKPEGTMVAMFGEHSKAVNRVVVAPDHSFFVTGSDDGSVKVWDSARLEKNVTRRSRQTHRHAAGAKVKSLAFVENTHTFVSGATDGSIHAVRVDYYNNNDTLRYGRLHVVREYQLGTADDGTAEYAVWMEHYRLEAQSTLLIATNTSRIIGIDMKTMVPIFTLQNPVHHGTPTTFCCDRKHNWMVVGTTHGILDLWDLRFRVRLKAWGLPGMSVIHRLQVHPTRGRGRWVCVGGRGNHGNEITVWDIEKVQCREVYRASTNGTQQNQQGNTRAIKPSDYTAWRVDSDRPEGMLSRFATAGATPVGIDAGIGGSGGVAPSSGLGQGICAFVVGFDAPEEGSKDISKSGFMITAGSDQTLRFWDLSRPEQSLIFSGVDISGSNRYEVQQATTTLMITTEQVNSGNGSGSGSGSGGGGSGGKRGTGTGTGSGKTSRSTVVSLQQQQQQLLRSHLDSIQDVGILRMPYGMTVSVDRAGMVYVFQ